jgi:hypothetical protein
MKSTKPHKVSKKEEQEKGYALAWGVFKNCKMESEHSTIFSLSQK